RQLSLTELLTRALTVSGVVYAAVFLYAVPAALFDGTRGSAERSGPSSLSQTIGGPAWGNAHARRFPDCVDLADWDPAAVPSTVVVVRRNRDVERMDLREASRRAASASAADDVWTIGACP
ncbi:MAG TPA: hypothetical protein VFZ64_11290, partial [Nocardioidaceae bacterium]